MLFWFFNPVRGLWLGDFSIAIREITSILVLHPTFLAFPALHPPYSLLYHSLMGSLPSDWCAFSRKAGMASALRGTCFFVLLAGWVIRRVYISLHNAAERSCTRDAMW